MGLDRTEQRLKMAKQAVDRAFQLKPDLTEGHMALGWYYYRCRDYDQALREFNIAQRYLRGDWEILMGISSVRRRQGYFEESLKLHKKAFELAPREAAIPMEIAVTLSRIRKYSEAVHYCDLSISLKPDQTNSYITKARAYWQQGSTEKGRSVLQEIPDQKHPEVIYFWVRQELYERNYQNALARLPFAISEIFTDSMVLLPWVELQGLIYNLKGEPKRARSSFETACVLLEKEAELRPDDHRVHSSLGISYAGLGRKEDAIREGKLAVQLYPTSKDALIGSQYVENLAQIYVMVGDYDAALNQLDYLLSIPSQISVPWIRIDPRWDPLRNNPRFQQLMKKYS
jgi:serine/threonine-protein kinase